MATPHPATNTVDSISALSFTLGEYTARLIGSGDEDEVRAYQALRHEWFVSRRGWVKDDPAMPGCEVDGYDPYCHHLGVFQEAQLVAYIRALPWQAEPGLMLQHEFRDLVCEQAFKKLGQAGDVELSRLIVAPPPGSARSETIAIAELLFKLVYSLGKRLEWSIYYIVLEEAWLRILNRRFALSFTPLGEPHVYPDGTRTLAAHAGSDTLEQSMLAMAPEKYQWYREHLAEHRK